MTAADVFAAFAQIAREEAGAGRAGGGYPASTGQSPHQQEERAVEWDYEIPPQPIPLAPSQYVKGLEMPGEGGSGALCGSAKSKTACPRVAEGRPGGQLAGAKDHSVAVTPHFCKSPRCRICWPMWLQRAALRGEERIRAAQALYLHRDPRHFTFSPPQRDAVIRLRREGASYLTNLYRSAYAMMRRAGLQGGLVVFHPWRCSGHGKHRYRTSHRRLAPHFHVVGFGYTTRSSEFHAKTGWLMKNHNAAREKRHRKHGRAAAPIPVFALLKYLLDHCGLNVLEKRTKDALRAFGDVHQLTVVEERKLEEPLHCASCNDQCWVYEYDPSNPEGFGPPLEAAVAVQVLRVYARHKKAKAPPGAPDFYYTIASEAPDPGLATKQTLLAKGEDQT